MPEILDSMPERRGRPQIYPWDEWSDGRVWKLHQGSDFYSEAKSFRVLTHRTAKLYGCKAFTWISDDETVITIQFYPDPAIGK